jgi:hypothetical protein
MSIFEVNKTIELYCKIPFTETTGIFKIRYNLTISELLEYVNIHVRNKLNIDKSYDIEVVELELGELGKPIETNNKQTLRQVYRNINNCFVFYVRPVHPITKVFIRKNDYTT